MDSNVLKNRNTTLGSTLIWILLGSISVGIVGCLMLTTTVSEDTSEVEIEVAAPPSAVISSATSTNSINAPNNETTDTSLTTDETLPERLTAYLDSAEVNAFLGLNENSTDITRRVALETILDRGTEEDIAFLFDFIAAEKSAAMPEAEWKAFLNNIVEYLVQEWPEQVRAETQLAALFNDSDVSLNTKEAVVRQLDSLYLRSSDPQPLENLLWNTATKPDHDIASTALSTLARLTEADSSVDRHKLRDVARSIVDNDRSSVTTRVTAMQIATWLESPDINAVASDIIKQNNQPPVIQLAAIATMIKVGDSSNLDALQKLSSGESYPMNKAASKAIQLINGQ